MTQNLIAILIVGLCFAYVAQQLVRSVRAGNGKAGSCCSKGCDAASTPATGPRVQFIESSSLRRKR